MSNSDSQTTPIPGMDVVGRGIHLIPRQPYELKDVMFEQKDWRVRYLTETGENYIVPQGYEVNDSPPMPLGVSLNQVSIEESIERLEKTTHVEASVCGGNFAFSVDANASQSGMMRRNENAYYARRSSFLPFWTVYLSNSSERCFDLDSVDLPVPFRHAHRHEYDRFFEKFGSHYVKRVWVGGRATLTFSVLKSNDMSEQDIRMGLKASFGPIGSGEGSEELKQHKQKLANHAECTVAGKGGDAQLLAALSSLDESLYNRWMQTIKGNPQAIELEVSGIWTLIKDEAKAKTLKTAYMAATSFDPICAVFCLGREVNFIREGTYSTYDVDKEESCRPKELTDRWPQLRPLGFDRIDAALSGDYLGQSTSHELSNRVFFFRSQWCISLNTETGEFSEIQTIAQRWPGVPFDHIDAALHFDPEFVYLFSGNRYVRFDVKRNQICEGYPQLTCERWHGLHFEKIDAAIYWGNGKVFFFRADQHIRYDIADFRADPGYPKHVTGNYVEDWKLFI